MKAVYKKELGYYFNSMIGYVFIALLLVIVGMYFTFTNVLGGDPFFTRSLSSALFIFLLAIPVLTMRSVAEERRSRTDQALLTSPNSVAAIVCGKYFAMVTVLALPLVFFCIFPLIIHSLGVWYPKSDYAGLMMFFLIGCVYISAGLFISSLTESQIISAVGTFAVVLLFYLWEQLINYLPYTPLSSFLGILLLCLLLFAILRTACGSFALAAGLAALCAAATAIAYAFRPAAFAGLLRRILLCFNVSGQLSGILNANALDLRGVVLDVSFAALFLVLTVHSIQKRRWS